MFDWQHFQDAAVKSGRSPPDPHVPPFATYELGVLYAQDEKVSKMPLNFRLSHILKRSHADTKPRFELSDERERRGTTKKSQGR